MNTIHIVVDSGADHGLEIHVPAGGALFGSDPGTEGIRLADPLLPSVAGRLYFRSGDGLWMESAGDAPVTVNGKPPVCGRLSIGDRIAAGSTCLQVVNDHRPIHLLVESGPLKGSHFGVPLEGAVFGRTPGEDGVLIDDPSVSRRQCRMFFKPEGGIWIEDLGASNETCINHVPVTLRRLCLNDLIEMGATVMRVVNDGGTVAAPRVERIAARFEEPPPAAPASGAVNEKSTRRNTIRVTSGMVQTIRYKHRFDWRGLLLRIVFFALLAYAARMFYYTYVIIKPLPQSEELPPPDVGEIRLDIVE